MDRVEKVERESERSFDHTLFRFLFFKYVIFAKFSFVLSEMQG